jgi:hypothetical protein
MICRPKQIGRYLVEVENFGAVRQLDENGRKFKIDPLRLLCALRWKHNATPPDVELVLVRERNPPVWFIHVATLLLDVLN